MTIQDHENRDLLPIVTEDNRERSARTTATVADPDGIESVEVYFDNGQMDESEQVLEDSGEGDEISVEWIVPQRLISPGENSFSVEVTDQKGRTEEHTSTFAPEIRMWKIDAPHSDYSTERKWDNLQFDQPLEELNGGTIKEQRQFWNDQMAYNTLIHQLKTDEKRVREKYNGNNHALIFSNAEGNSYGHWDINRFEQLTNVSDIFLDATSATQIRMLKAGETNWSTENDHIAATIQKLVNDVHGTEDRNMVETTYVNQGGHGTVMAYADLENTDLEAEHSWHWVDTTEDHIVPLGVEAENGSTTAENALAHGYNAFIQGYKGEEQVSDPEHHYRYDTEKIKAVAPLLGFLDRSDKTQINKNTISISDPVLENIYNEHVPEGEAANPIIDMVMKASQLQIETGEYVQVYGDSLEYNQDEEVFEGLEYAINEGNIYSLHNRSMDADTRLTKDRVDRFLKEAAT